jgi:hypothetical protein
VASDIVANGGVINRDLFNYYAGTLRKAIGTVYHDTPNELFLANVTRFSAYKAYQCSRIAQTPHGDTPQVDIAKITVNQFNAWLQTEYNTAVARARTAKQFDRFNEPDKKRLFPNIMWLPSRSVTLREEHTPFYNRVWAKNDPFWNTNSPGTLWNCKCDMQETAESVTDNSDIPAAPVPRGLEGNPATTGEIFTDNASYITGAGKRGNNAVRNLQRVLSKELLTELYNEKAYVIINGSKTEVIFDSTTKKHISNDIVEYKDWLWQININNFTKILNAKKPIACEKNTKLDKKPSAQNYYYFEHKIGNETLYFNIEENYVERDSKHFFRLYALTNKLRDTAISIK